MNPIYRDFIRINQGAAVKHLYNSLESMLASDKEPCLLHPQRRCCGEPDPGIALGVTGSPCNPFSTQRTKRFSDGSISNHAMSVTTMASVLNFYTAWEPHAGITEQVQGFGMRTSSSDPETPLEKFLDKTETVHFVVVF